MRLFVNAVDGFLHSYASLDLEASPFAAAIMILIQKEE